MMPLKIQQDYIYKGDDWWKWWIWIEGTGEELNSIDYVIYKLHKTFPNPVRKISDRKTKFRLETGGWGVFRIYAKVYHKDKSESNLEHDLKLYYPDDDLRSGAKKRGV